MFWLVEYSKLISHFSIPCTGVSIWVLCTGILLFRFVRHFRVSVNCFGAAIIVCAIPSIICFSLLNRYTPVFELIQPNYYGVSSRIPAYKETRGLYDKYLFKLTFAKRNPELNLRSVVDESYGKDSDGLDTSVEGFLTWQAGVVKGYLFGKELFSNRIALFFIIGPIVLMELFALSVMKHTLGIIVFQVIWFAVRKKHVWWDNGKNSIPSP